MDSAKLDAFVNPVMDNAEDEPAEEVEAAEPEEVNVAEKYADLIDLLIEHQEEVLTAVDAVDPVVLSDLSAEMGEDDAAAIQEDLDNLDPKLRAALEKAAPGLSGESALQIGELALDGDEDEGHLVGAWVYRAAVLLGGGEGAAPEGGADAEDDGADLPDPDDLMEHLDV